jgi:uncharacterized protein YuzE
MAFIIEQQFDDVQHHYDREGDVLYISFGPPMPAVSIPVEDWFLIRITPKTPRICGFTFIGFKRLFSKIRPDLIKELPARVERLKRAKFFAQYIDETDTFTIRFEEDQPAYYERLEDDIYTERALVSGDIIGFKLTHYTEHGAALMGKVVSAMLDALFAQEGTPPGPADALTRAFLEHLDLPKLLAAGA